MSVMYRVDWVDGVSVIVYSADAKSVKAKDIRAAYVKVRAKANAKRAKMGLRKAAVASAMCVG